MNIVPGGKPLLLTLAIFILLADPINLSAAPDSPPAAAASPAVDPDAPKVEIPVPAVAGDPLSIAAAGDASGKQMIRGRLVYTFLTQAGGPPGAYYFDIRNVQVDRGVVSSSAVYYSDFAGQPKFSPNGRFVLMNWSMAESNETDFEPHILDLQTHTDKRVTHGWINVLPILWSPDSRYLAYVVGIDTPFFSKPYQLYVYDCQTGKEKIIKTIDLSLIQGFTWGFPHTLYYSAGAEPATQQKPPGAHGGSKPRNEAAEAFPIGIFRASPETGRSSLFLRSAYRPMVSPDGKWIAFFGPEHPEKPYPFVEGWETYPRGLSLSVVRSDGSGRRALNAERSASYPAISWLPDNQRLAALQTTALDHGSQAAIEVWDVLTGRRHPLAQLQTASPPMAWNAAWPFEIKAISRDGKTLFVGVSDISKRTNDSRTFHEDMVVSLQTVDLVTGAVAPFATSRGDYGWDWLDESTPLATPSATPSPKPPGGPSGKK